MAEDQLWSWLSPFLPRGEYSRVESGDTSSGIPDVFYQLDSENSGWLELKDADRVLQFPFSQKGLRPSQLRWIRRNSLAGARIWIVARNGKKIYWIEGKKAPLFNNSTDRELESMSIHVMHLDANLRKIDVKAIDEMLRGKRP